MARKRFTAEQIIIKLREAEGALAQGKTVVQIGKLPRSQELGSIPWSGLHVVPGLT